MHLSKYAALLLVLSLLWVGAGTGASAQTGDLRGPTPPTDAALLAQLNQLAGGGVQTAVHAATGKLRFLSAPAGRPIAAASGLAAATPEQAARAFLASYGQLFGLSSPDRELTLMQQEALAGRSFVRFQQVYQGIPVLAGELVVQTTAQRAVASTNGEILPGLQLDVQPRVAADQAASQALAAVAKYQGVDAAGLRVSAPQLWIYNPALLGGPGIPVSRLVWRTEVKAAAAGEPIRELVLIDAQTGKLALHFNQIADAKRRFVCNDKNTVDADGNPDNNCTPDKYVRSEGQAATGNADVDLAYDYSGKTYDYYFNNFGRDSLDGKGLPLISLVKYCDPSEACPFENAFWDGHQMTYGDGFASADDVVGHELTHGFTDFTSHLFYYYQSGAINESLSDVFGELIDQTDGAGNDSPAVAWQMGEDLPASFGVIRDMSDPTRFNDPDRTGSTLYKGDSTDSGGVHTNSGVNNKAAYLIAAGGSFNGQTITGLGLAKTGALYYTVEVAYLTSGSDYQDLYNYLPAACASLAASGAYGLTASDCAQVLKAVTATEMNLVPDNATAPEAAVCNSGNSQDLFFDDFENPASGNWASAATSGSLDGWYYPPTVNPYNFDATYATSGKYNLWGDDPGGNPNTDPPAPADFSIAMTRDIAVPANTFMHFRHAFGFETSVSGLTNYDGGVVEYSTNGGTSWNDAGSLFTSGSGQNGYNATLDTGNGNPLEGRAAFGGASLGYISSRADLSGLAGQNVRFRFRIGADNYSGDYGWFIDDVRIYTCSATPPVASLAASSLSVKENAGTLKIQLNLNGVTSQPVTVPFTVGGTATNVTDYRLSARAFVIPAGSSSGIVTLQPVNDGAKEPTETVVLTLGSPTNATLSGGSIVTISLLDSQQFLYLPLVRR
jgi:Zn-dependent metalloprotease